MNCIACTLFFDSSVYEMALYRYFEATGVKLSDPLA